jgi:hypothetical protein
LQPSLGAKPLISVALMGNVFRLDGYSEPARRSARALDEHRAELLGDAPASG